MRKIVRYIADKRGDGILDIKINRRMQGETKHFNNNYKSDCTRAIVQNLKIITTYKQYQLGNKNNAAVNLITICFI